MRHVCGWVLRQSLRARQLHRREAYMLTIDKEQALKDNEKARGDRFDHGSHSLLMHNGAEVQLRQQLCTLEIGHVTS